MLVSVLARSTKSVLMSVGALSFALLTIAGCSAKPAEDAVSVAEVAPTSRALIEEESTAETLPIVDVRDAEEADNLVSHSNALGLQMLNSFQGQTVVTSPASTVVALATLASGSDGETEDEISVILGASGDPLNQAVNALVGSLDSYSGALGSVEAEVLPDNPQLHFANQIVVDEGLELETTYLDSINTWYETGLLVTELEDSRRNRELDDWVEANTAGQIGRSALEIGEDTQLALQSSIVFAAGWQNCFVPEETGPSTFNRFDGTTVESDFMNGTFKVPYAEVEGWQMVELPYDGEGGIVARYVMSPADKVVSSIEPSTLAELETALEIQMVAISIPKLDITSTAYLSAPLQKQGVTAIFDGPPLALHHIADLSDLRVDQIVQQGRIRVDEVGTVVSKISEVVESEPDSPTPNVAFTANRPHVIVVEDKTTGWHLLHVLVNDPTVSTNL